MSSGLRNKSYVFRGEQLSREEYLNHLKDENLDCYSSYGAHREEFVSLMNNSICRYANIKKSYDCTGDMIESSNNCKNCFGLLKVENSKYIYMGDNTTADCYDMFHTGRMQNCYEIAVAGSDCASDSFCVDVGTCIDSQYSISCNNCQSIFGCIGLQNKSYCILNKQYTKDEYIELVPKIIKSMNKAPFVDKAGRTYLYGEFFPSELSPFAYNESIVYENFPKSKQEVGLMGYAWLDSFKKENRGDMLIDDLPDRISDITEDILSKTIICPNSGQVETQCTSAYKIVPEELRFYRLMNIPIPRYCPNCRFHKRKDLVLPWKLWHRTCMCDKAGHLHEGKCEVQFETSYAPDRPEIVYCEKCYQQEVV